MDVSAFHVVLSQAVPLIRVSELYESKPRSEPCNVILADPVAPIFNRRDKLTVPISVEKMPEILPQ